MKKKISVILIILFVLVSLVLVVHQGGKRKEIGSEEHWTQIDELHSVDGMKNHWIISTSSKIGVESFKKISIPLLNWSTKWRTNNLKKVNSLVRTDTYVKIEEKGKWDVQASIEYFYTTRKILGIIKINYITPKYLKDIRRRNHQKCKICNNFKNGRNIKKEQSTKKIVIKSKKERKNTKIKFHPKTSTTTKLNVTTLIIETKTQPYILITKQNTNKIYYKKTNSTIHFKN